MITEKKEINAQGHLIHLLRPRVFITFSAKVFVFVMQPLHFLVLHRMIVFRLSTPKIILLTHFIFHLNTCVRKCRSTCQTPPNSVLQSSAHLDARTHVIISRYLLFACFQRLFMIRFSLRRQRKRDLLHSGLHFLFLNKTKKSLVARINSPRGFWIAK